MNTVWTKGVICFTNPQQLPFIIQKGMYGNVNSGDVPQKTSTQAALASARIRYGKLKDLLCVTPGDYVFLFERDKSRLHGVWKVSDEPFFCSSQDFDPSNDYPYRLYIQPYLNFQNTVPAMELRKLLNKGSLWSIRTFERELAAAFASINPISSQEAEALIELFYRYNHLVDPTQGLITYDHTALQNQVNFCDLVKNNQYTSLQPTKIVANNFGTCNNISVEEALHCYLFYNLARHSTQMMAIFGQYDEVLREVPISIAGQHRADFLLLYHNPIFKQPSVYSLGEVKKGTVTVDMLSQLLEYIRLFSERHGIDLDAIEGIYIGSSFEDDAKAYVEKRAKIEVERPIRLLEYKLVGNNITIAPP